MDAKQEADAKLAARLAEARHDAGLTQMELAVKLGCNLSSVTQWESGVRRPTLDNLRRLAEALGVTLSSLLD
jgi:transcriptional regulator with XRE-family HTH domain